MFVLTLFFSTAHLSVFVQYRMFAVLVLLYCTVGVVSVLYIGNSGTIFGGGIISSASYHFEKQGVATGGTE